MMAVTLAHAQQISIGGNVYGGGNAGNTGGSTSVTVRGGNIDGSVFGGARQADVGGSAFVNIDGAHSTSYILINQVYGGNDISGTIGTSEVPDALTLDEENHIDNTWNAFVRISSKKEFVASDETTTSAVYIGELFGGGNGDYEYIPEENGEHHIKDKVTGEIIASAPVSERDFIPPVLDKTYLEIVGGSIIWAFGGGNQVTVNQQTVICVDNPSDVVYSIKDNGTDLLLDDARIERMGVNPGYSNATSDAFQIGSFFGGNNQAPMAIRPIWNLKKGKIRNLYSGGNKGAMTSPVGLLLNIPTTSEIVVDNVYGGCRMADVRPMEGNADVGWNDIKLPDTEIDEETGQPIIVPTGLSARVIIRGGDINNVYGGNDISGRVWGGNAVGIHTSIRGDVYGGGNGSYPYTDNSALANDKTYGDLYYSTAGYSSSAEALNDFRPNAEQVSIRVIGKENVPTIIHGSIYLGGNSATLKTSPERKPMLELKIGSYVIADNVFLGNNGVNMISTVGTDDHQFQEGVLRTYKRPISELISGTYTGDSKFNSMDLTQADVFAKYMDGCAMTLMPSVVFDKQKTDGSGDPATYIPYSSYFGSFYCGGNVGSMISSGTTTIKFDHKVVIYDKLVGGCNNAYVAKTSFNAAYQGGLIGSENERDNYTDDGLATGNIKDRLILNLEGLKIQPKRWPIADVDDDAAIENSAIPLVWNTVKLGETDNEGNPVPVAWNNKTWKAADDTHTQEVNSTINRRFRGGNIYGGCHASGVVNGNVVINIGTSIIDRDIVFDDVETDEETGEVLYNHDTYTINNVHSGVILDEQGMDVLGLALNVFGGGKGKETEIWGSTTVNLNSGYVFQIFGGSEEGAIGRGVLNENTHKIEYTYNPKYSTYVNLSGTVSGQSRSAYSDDDMAEAEFLYGGGFAGPIAGDTHINLGNGRIFNSFAGSCNADIQGHTETIIGVNNGFPYVRDHLYGGNDLGGAILGKVDFKNSVRTSTNDGYDAIGKVSNSDMLKASAYIEYNQGRVVNIYGGCYGVYDYTNSLYRAYFNEDGTARSGYSKPFLSNAFINFRPNNSTNPLTSVKQVYGAGQGYLGEKEENKMQESSYILIDIPQSMQAFQSMEVFGAGECGGVGMYVDLTGDNPDYDKASAIIDLARGQINAVYGGSYQEGITRRTVVNVPEGSTIKLNNIFGGAYGVQNDVACDVYESNVNYNSANALVGGYQSGIYGGNNNYRRTLYSKVNINAPVWYDKENDYYATVYGAGYGKDTWAQYTEVNLNNTAKVFEVYGGGQLGRVMNKKSVDNWKAQEDAQSQQDNPDAPVIINIALEGGYTDQGLASNLATYKYNTNVRINQGATVSGYIYNGDLSGAYAYGGGLGSNTIENAGDVHGTTFIGLYGGRVVKDIYAAGTIGSVNNRYNVATDDFDRPFVATTNAYIEGGTTRNVYGGGWKGSVGYHPGLISDTYQNDIYGATNVVIGKTNGTSYIDGIPTIERNAYAGGEGGGVFGTANVTLYNGYIGYTYNVEGTDDPETENINERYEEKLDDETRKDGVLGTLDDSGCIFGGGYIDNSNVDITNVVMYGGHVRNSLFGGGEIAAIGRGIIEATGDDKSIRSLKGIYKAGKTNVKLYEGYVHRNVFGGGRGYNNLGEGGTLFSDGYVFGQTEVHIYGGEVGTTRELLKGNGNVFGGGDIGYVYSAYENQSGALCVGKKDGNRYDDQWEGYYYKIEGGAYNDQGEYVVPNGTTNGGWVMDGEEYTLTEDCKVLVEPHCKVLAADGVTIDTPDAEGHLVSTHYNQGDFVPTSALNTLENKNEDRTRWQCLEINGKVKGIIIHNAVFAGGNTSSGSSKAYANATSVFGNATASIHDVFHRDLITVGTGHTGGLYGDGNLTFVDGYRGLNITNYGTDYYTIGNNTEISIDQYHALDEREQAYYELRYKCIKECTDKDGTTYHPADPSNPNSKASTLNADDLLTLFDGVEDGNVALLVIDANDKLVPNPIYWKENGVCTIYAGRIMNTIQRADFCGVFGSRMVMQGAQDRVPEVVDYTNYTINRVREVSLNKQHTVIAGDLILKDGGTAENEEWVNVDKAVHGNYFGIYNIVNFLGGLTSDVHFTDKRVTDNLSNESYTPPGETFMEWKEAKQNDRTRNNGNSFNKVALASGVYLELTTEKSTGNEIDQKDWGYITGIIELDLINVQTGIGGGFVYAKNEHRTWTYDDTKKHSTLTALNKDAITRKDFMFSNEYKPYETSGNFVHSTQIIIDDCYNVSGKYMPGDAVPAHYWFIQGQVYVYDQYISAYTGAPNAYSETVDIPLTITAASHGTMKLLNIQPNKYAYWKKAGTEKLGADQKMVVNDVDYYLNDPISYWDWYLLSKSEKSLFVDQTYVTITDCTVGEGQSAVNYPAGTVLLPDDYDALKSAAATATIDGKSVKAVTQTVDGVTKNLAFDYVFRSSNNMGHDTGYLLTYKVNNPTEWNTWYTKDAGAWNNKLSSEEYTNQDGYDDGPTYHLNIGGDGLVLGQQDYNLGNLIPEETYLIYEGSQTNPEKYPGIKSKIPTGQQNAQAAFERAYMVTKELTATKKDGTQQHLNPGVPVAQSEYTTGQWSAMSGSVAEAYICTSTIQLSKTEFIYLNTRMTAAEKTAYYNRFHKDGATAVEEQIATDIDELIVPAYYCTKEGLYGGNYYEAGHNYRGLAAWCSMSETDRANFTFNYDALDLLIDKNYGGTVGEKYQYDGSGYSSEADVKNESTGNKAGYSLTQPLNYTATYNSETNLTLTGDVIVKRSGNNTTTSTIQKEDELSRSVYESLPNEQRYYAPIKVQEAGTYYVVNAPIQIGNTPYAVGSTLSAEVYNNYANSLEQGADPHVTEITFGENDRNKTFYYCREEYTVGHLGEGKAVKAVIAGGGANVGDTKNIGATVPVGFIISKDGEGETHAYGYSSLVNKQKNFTIHGIAPTETSTLFVSRNSDIFDLSKEKIITVIYQYDYEEGDALGNVTPLSERHVINIHVAFKSGIPTVEDIRAPQIVIPGDVASMREPNVTPGAYEVTGGGWELFEKKSDVESHVNGVEFMPNFDPLYWYQDGYYLAYYAKTYLGKTYSNEVQVSVANYHDLKKVMEDKDHHYYIDKPDLVRLKRNPKVYINDGTDGLNQLKNFYDLSLLTEAPTDGVLAGHALLDEQVKGCQDMDFILRRNITIPENVSWTPIGETVCFGGNIHGDGYYIDGLDHSLFNKLCGNVYNLGVKGSFTGAGIAETGDGYVENCWISTSSIEAKTQKPILGEPTNLSEARPYRIVNCYYEENDDATNKYTNHSSTYGIPTRMGHDAFHDGDVAYNLNGFYLYKRYSDKNTTESGNMAYQFYTYTVGSNNSLSAPQTKWYSENKSICSSGVNGGKYVEDRFADGDFQYAEGVVPSMVNSRQYVKEDGTIHFYPIWPDDYIYFGQMLTYRWREDRPHEEVPSRIYKSSDRLVRNDQSNRVYRAPAYFGSKEMSMAHFNPSVNLVAYSKKLNESDTKLHPAYPGMTAIDFAGHNDVSEGYKLGLNDNRFYPPLLDDDGIVEIINRDETKNLLVYAPANDPDNVNAPASRTYQALKDYFTEPVFEESGAKVGYRCVAEASSNVVAGHLVLSDNTAANDHLLVDEQDFNCPISYNMGAHRMWYQRLPKKYVTKVNGKTKGWGDICLPFTAELVTTQDKGEITHFYQDSNVAHEYWLREFKDVGTVSNGELPANFIYPDAGNSEKDYNNTFLWDYYYSKDSSKDDNEDIYQTEYYSEDYLKTLYPVDNYPLFQVATPYLVGFPGSTYYEFDLSGQFEAQNTYGDIDPLPAQTISFVSNVGATIGESDGELATGAVAFTVTVNNVDYIYTFYPTYTKTQLEADVSYLLNSDGDKYVLSNDVPTSTPFHPYFKQKQTNHSGSRGQQGTVNSIIFNNEVSNLNATTIHMTYSGEDLLVKTGRKKIVVESQLREDADVRIVTPAGITLSSFSIEPGEIVETRIESSGVYIVYAANGKYVKKVIVK